MSMSGEPISKCPVCRYDLTGLPKNHTCPECGFALHESMLIWWTNRKKRAHVFDYIPHEVLIGAPLLLGAVGLAAWDWRSLAVCFVIAVFLLGYYLRPSRHWFVILSDIGLTHGVQGGEWKFYRWEQLEVPAPSLLGLGKGKHGLQLQLHHIVYEIERTDGSEVRSAVALPMDVMGHFEQTALKTEIHRRWQRAVNPNANALP